VIICTLSTGVITTNIAGFIPHQTKEEKKRMFAFFDRAVRGWLLLFVVDLCFDH
jgi:hypothetical protein